MARELHFRRCTEGRFFKLQFKIVTKVRSALDAIPAATPAAATEEIAKPEDVAEHVTEIREYVGSAIRSRLLFALVEGRDGHAPGEPRIELVEVGDRLFAQLPAEVNVAALVAADEVD